MPEIQEQGRADHSRELHAFQETALDVLLTHLIQKDQVTTNCPHHELGSVGLPHIDNVTAYKLDLSNQKSQTSSATVFQKMEVVLTGSRLSRMRGHKQTA